ncbi:MAG: hypothetical protein ACLR9W_07930 [Enterobacter hormaechei]
MNPLYQKHIISINDLSRASWNWSGNRGKTSQSATAEAQGDCERFFEASTRTRLLLETSMHRPRERFGQQQHVAGQKARPWRFISVSTYVDAIVMRHPQEGAARWRPAGGIPVLNAGDGANQHLMQTLLDLFTIQETLARLRT